MDRARELESWLVLAVFALCLVVVVTVVWWRGNSMSGQFVTQPSTWTATK